MPTFVFPDSDITQGDNDVITQTPIVEMKGEEVEPMQQQTEHPIFVLCIDNSGSMSITDTSEGISRLDMVKRYASDFVKTDKITALDKERTEFCMLTFATKVIMERPFAPMSTIDSDFSSLNPYGLTSIYSAMITAILAAKKRRDELINAGISCFKPVIFFLTDGKPEGATDLKLKDDCIKLVKHYIGKDDQGKSKMHMVVCGLDGCDMGAIEEISPDIQLIQLRNSDALKEAFQMMTASIAAVSSSMANDEVNLVIGNLKNLGMVEGANSTLVLGN